ncbi:GNAT family N-acetyltransferase [Microbacterium sediminis]|uniref:Phosphinothricin acetyltransferase n=1 Tax=Microbacterium sediminis TaxID=904291 RepID=A0A1B9NE38_9MICO|nr:GNAT family N-acetyltransferase [Microbacterium sediminis]OCG74869.1 phosphinothricin acetyltransferase [Microbacterium sediminis]QBR75535.1 N-acetyltransferase family protein [Microbacterium sediminis]
MTPEDWPEVELIYRAGIDTGNATFETEAPAWDRFDATRLPHPRLVAEVDGAVAGWVAASPVSARPVYRGVVEHSIYIDPAAQGRGVGRALLEAFIAQAEAAGIWTIQSSIFPENEASLRLHRAAGFREVGRRERIAQATAGPYAGQWRDTILIERRSA